VKELKATRGRTLELHLSDAEVAALTGHARRTLGNVAASSPIGTATAKLIDALAPTQQHPSDQKRGKGR
jgi:hypothetical protein